MWKIQQETKIAAFVVIERYPIRGTDLRPTAYVESLMVHFLLRSQKVFCVDDVFGCTCVVDIEDADCIPSDGEKDAIEQEYQARATVEDHHRARLSQGKVFSPLVCSLNGRRIGHSSFVSESCLL